MSLPASQRRALNQIEKTLTDDHPTLGPLFAIFNRLTGHEAMPVIERVTAPPWRWQRRMRPGVAVVVGLAMATAALLTLSLLAPGPPQVCVPGMVTPIAAHAQSVPAGRQHGCPAQQNKLSKTSQSEP